MPQNVGSTHQKDHKPAVLFPEECSTDVTVSAEPYQEPTIQYHRRVATEDSRSISRQSHVRYDMIWFGKVWYVMVWYGMVSYCDEIATTDNWMANCLDVSFNDLILFAAPLVSIGTYRKGEGANKGMFLLLSWYGSISYLLTIYLLMVRIVRVAHI